MRFSIFLASLMGMRLLAATAPQTETPNLPLQVKTIYQFPTDIWLESIEARSNGDLLLSDLSTAILYSIDPSSSSPKPKLIHTFSSVTALVGLAEVTPDVFAVIAGNLTSTNDPIAKSFSIWTVNFNMSPPKISKAADFPESGLLNGLAILPGVPNTILAADSTLGAVWKLNTKTGAYSIAIQIPEMLAPPPPAFHLGINGLRVRDGYLYFTNTGSASFLRVKITTAGTVVPGAKVETLYISDTLLDDFAFDKAGTAYLNTNVENTIVAVGQDGKSAIVAGALGQLTIAGGTSAVFGHGRADCEILYVATCGGLGAPINGTVTEPGKVVGIDTRGFRI